MNTSEYFTLAITQRSALQISWPDPCIERAYLPVIAHAYHLRIFQLRTHVLQAISDTCVMFFLVQRLFKHFLCSGTSILRSTLGLRKSDRNGEVTVLPGLTSYSFYC